MKPLLPSACTGRTLLLALTLTASAFSEAAAQGTVRRHLVQFTNKTGTPFNVAQPAAFLSARAIQRRTNQSIPVSVRDLPPTPGYIQQVRAIAGVQVIYRTRWLNGAIIECDSTHLAQVQALPFVRGAQTLNRPVKAGKAGRSQPTVSPKNVLELARPSSPNPYGIAFAQAEQIGVPTMHAAGYRGEGMQIAVFDAGFPTVDQLSAFQALYQDNRLLSTFDVVQGGTNVYNTHPHGTWVLSTMAANLPNAFIGTAPNASYRLIRTEDTRNNTETPAEEAYWLIGAEYADSAGVDIITSSLGYHDFDLPAVSYTYADMNGHTPLITRAADLASGTGMLVVNSAGNDGGNPWRFISAPADGDSVLTVGAVDSLGFRAGFSSVGPTADGRIKPNLATQGQDAAVINPGGVIGRGSGTSFACPIMAGMAAGFWQANPTLTAQQVRRFLEQSGSQANNPDNNLGYGIPNFRRAYNLANPGNPLQITESGSGLSVPELYPNPVPGAAFALRLPSRMAGQKLTVRLTDAVGKLLNEQEITTATPDSVSINAGQPVLKPGMYFCTVRAASGEQHTLRFVKN